MKKIINLILIMLIICSFSLCACGSNDNKDGKTDNKSEIVDDSNNDTNSDASDDTDDTTPQTTFTITIEEVNTKISVKSQADKDEVVECDITPLSGYIFLYAKYNTTTDVIVTDSHFSFNMPEHDVKITAVAYENDELMYEKVSARTSNQSIDKNSAVDNYILAYHKLNNQAYIKYEALGTEKAAGVKQDFKITKAKVDNNYFCEELTNGIVKPASRYYYTHPEKVVDIYKDTADEDFVCDFTRASHSQQDIDEFNYKNGIPVYDFTKYLVNNYTTYTSVYNGINNGNYSFTITLNPKLATEKYGRKVIKTSNSQEPPVFESVSLTFEIDDDFTLHSIEYKEQYLVTIAVLGQVTTTEASTCTFTYEKFDIPAI